VGIVLINLHFILAWHCLFTLYFTALQTKPRAWGPDGKDHYNASKRLAAAALQAMNGTQDLKVISIL
jgi:hypothetical protein